MTKKLYYLNSHMADFDAVVVSCREGKKGYEIILDQTAFFPEGGGQPGDSGVLGGVRVFDTHERDGEAVHYTDAPLEPGQAVHGRIDWEKRFQRMQNHSGEHVVSGTIHSLYGFDNVGFHMSPGEVTIDADGELDEAMVRRVERLANEAVWCNVTVTTAFPLPDELKAMTYRSKLDLTENVRIVTVEGVDVCACCAPHVSRTGEIGMIKITSFMRHRGGTRMTMVCGGDALADYVEKADTAAAVGALLSVKQKDAPAAVERLKSEVAELKFQAAKAAKERALSALDGLEKTDGNLCLFEKGLDMDSLRALVNAALPLCGGICAGFSQTGDDWQYVMASAAVDMRSEAKRINAAIDGKGGGSAAMIQGSAKADESEIRAFFS